MKGPFARGPFARGAFMRNSGVGAPPATGEPTPTLTLYLDIVNGNDTNNGLTPETAIQTFNEAHNKALLAGLTPGQWLKLVVIDMGEGGASDINGSGMAHYGYSLWLDAQEACSLTVVMDQLAEADQFYFTGTLDFLSFGPGIDSFVENPWTMVIGGTATINAVYTSSAPGTDAYTDEFETYNDATDGADSQKIRFNGTLSIGALYVTGGNGGTADLDHAGGDGGDARDCYREAGVTITSSVFTPGTGGAGSPAGTGGSTGSVILV